MNAPPRRRRQAIGSVQYARLGVELAAAIRYEQLGRFREARVYYLRARHATADPVIHQWCICRATAARSLAHLGLAKSA